MTIRWKSFIEPLMFWQIFLVITIGMPKKLTINKNRRCLLYAFICCVIVTCYCFFSRCFIWFRAQFFQKTPDSYETNELSDVLYTSDRSDDIQYESVDDTYLNV